MADKPLNQVTKVTDLSKVNTFLAVMDDNTIQQMSKEDMATVVGGLQGNPLSYKGKASGLWKNLDSGIYQVDTISEDGPSGAYQHGILIVVKRDKTSGYGALIYKPVGLTSRFLYIAGFAIYSSGISLRDWEVYSAV